MGNQSPRYNSLQGWSCPFKRSLFPLCLWYPWRCELQLVVAVPPGCRAPGHGGMALVAGHTWPRQPLQLVELLPATAVKWQEGSRPVAASVGTVHGLLQSTTAPPAFPSFPFMKEEERMVIILLNFPSGASQG